MEGILTGFIMASALWGAGLVYWILFKQKDLREEIAKERAKRKTQEVINELIKKKMPASGAGRVNLLNSLESGDK